MTGMPALNLSAIVCASEKLRGSTMCIFTCGAGAGSARARAADAAQRTLAAGAALAARAVERRGSRFTRRTGPRTRAAVRALVRGAPRATASSSSSSSCAVVVVVLLVVVVGEAEHDLRAVPETHVALLVHAACARARARRTYSTPACALTVPKMARPTRTIVAPSSTATSKSFVMPIDSSVQVVRHRCASPAGAPAARAARGTPSGRPRAARERRHRHQPADLDAGHVAARPAARPRPPSGSNPCLLSSRRDVHLQQHRLHDARPRARGGRSTCEQLAASRPSGSGTPARRRRCDLVRLQRADEVPALVGEQRRACRRTPARGSRRSRGIPRRSACADLRRRRRSW